MLFTRAPGMVLAASSKKYIVAMLACMCQALLSVIFSHFSKNSPTEPPTTHTLQNLLDASVLSFKGDLDWNK